MSLSSTPPGQNVEIRCPRLGQQIHFEYCRTENQGLPCFKALDCWYHHFLIEAYFRENLSAEEWKRAIAEDGLTWNHISHIAYFEDEIALLYNVRAIPASFILDENGIIVAKDLRGPELEAKIAELLP